MTPTVQSLETTVVATFDPRTHERRPALRLGTASFGITLTNTRRAELTGVAVSDPLSPRCNRTIGRLAPGAAFAYACSAANVGRDYVNTATAFARSPGGSRLLARAGARGTVIATARSFVRVKKPRKKVHVPSIVFKKPPRKKVHVPSLAFTG